MAWRQGRQHRGRRRWRGVGVEGGDDDAEGGGRKSGSLMAQLIFTASQGFASMGYSPLYPEIIHIDWHSATDTKNEITGIG
jgi:hypothetical protein